MAEPQLSADQRDNIRKLREMHYRFNEIVAYGRDVVLRNKVQLLTGKTILTTVAILTGDRVEMGNVQG